MTSLQKIVTSLSFFLFVANLEQSRSRIPDAWSVTLSFSKIVTFYLTKTENKTEKSVTELSYYEGHKMLIFCYKDMLTSTKLRGSWYYKIYFLKLHMCVCTSHQISSFQVSSIILTSFILAYRKTNP